ncbi:MAG TPA: site-specific DNA-methyltransferase [Chloroflexota bacterium]|nr:site-specific DNA-methyltransferase [Chloroflexota bacterium]
MGKVKLAHLDPPFNRQQSFLHYDDELEHSVWLTMMRDRLAEIKTLLSPNGSVWVHCDDSEQAYLRAVTDEPFGRENFVATVIWEKTDSPRMDERLFSGRRDYILVFRQSEEFQINQLVASDPGEHYIRVDEDGRRYYIRPLRARGPRPLRWQVAL